MTEPRPAPTHTPMSQFRSAGGELLVNAQPISRIAKATCVERPSPAWQ